MTKQEFNTLMSAARSDSSCGSSIDHKFRQLVYAEKQAAKSPLPRMRPITVAALFLLAFGGVLGLGHAIREVQYVAAHYQQEQEDMRAARGNMLSNTEHIYSVLFEDMTDK